MDLKRLTFRITCCVLFVAVLAGAACRPQRSPIATPTPTRGPSSAPASAQATATPSSTATVRALTPTPTHTPSPIATPSPTPTPAPTHPLMIEVMRHQAYPGSDIVIEETLRPGVNYDRYIASYRSEGLKIYALLTVPRGERPEAGWPAIVFNHGYIPPEQYRTTERYVAYVDGFARNGYVVFRPDYRGHGSSEGEPTGAFTSPAYTVDVLNAVGALLRYPEVDGQRIGMWGHSMGGTLTLRGMVVTDDIKAGVIWAGVVAPIQDLWERRRAWIANHLTATPDPGGAATRSAGGLFAFGTFDENPEFWASVDPVSYLTDLSGPLQLHHGTGDQSVPVDFSEDLYARLQEAGQLAELYVYPGDNHNLTGSFGKAMARSIQFFDIHVKGVDLDE